tara:strand:+ start:199 stop:636 length:438 start_codon:yes stop_codon:yes gene_type:complete
MKQLREHIQKEIKTLMEKRYPMPPEIKMALVDGLNLRPLIRYVATLKAVNTVPPSYRVFFHNHQHIDLLIQEIGIQALINNKTFWVITNGGVDQEATIAIKELNRVLTQPIPVSSEEETEEEPEETGGDSNTEMEPEETEEEPEA